MFMVNHQRSLASWQQQEKNPVSGHSLYITHCNLREVVLGR